MTKLLVCIDGSAYADNITTNAAWAAKRLGASVDLLHVLRRHSDYQAPHEDHTGAIGLGARSDLMTELTKVDEERGKLDQQKGRLILEHAKDAFAKAEVTDINLVHRRGSLVETIEELEANVDMIFIGKRGEQANPESEFLGSNLEKVARSIHKPLFVVSRYVRPIKTFLIAFDGKDNALKAVDFACESPLTKGLNCHIITVGSDQPDNTDAAMRKLKDAGYTVSAHHEKDGDIEDVIQAYVEHNNIDLVLAGAYSHSRVRTILLGSTTARLIKSCHVPFVLFR